MNFITRSTFELNKSNLNQSEKIIKEIINYGDSSTVDWTYRK